MQQDTPEEAKIGISPVESPVKTGALSGSNGLSNTALGVLRLSQ